MALGLHDMGLFMVQNDFSHGELDRKMFARADLAVYNKSAQRLRNVVVIPQGGARRRFGSKFVQTIVQNTGRYMLIEFQFNAAVNYLFMLEPGELTIFFKDPETGITSEVAHFSSPTSYLPWTSDDLLDRSIRFTQTTNLIVIMGNFQPSEIKRVSHPSTWSIARFNVKNPPTRSYPDLFEGVNLKNANFKLTSSDPGAGRTLTSTGAAIFTSEFVGGIFNAIGPPQGLGRIGVARITQLNNSSQVVVDVLSEFDESVASTGVTGTNVGLSVPAFSAQRGWPVSGTFYLGRLWFGGTKGGSKPDSDLAQDVFGSVVNDFENFDTGVGDPADSIQAPIKSKNTNIIRFLVADKTLQVFTDSAEFATPQDNEVALTPGNIAIRPQTSEGIENVEPVVLDGQTFFVARGGKNIHAYSFSVNTLSYLSPDISVLSPSLIRNPVDSAVLKGSSTDDANYLMFVNGDGTLAVFQSLVAENVAAWTLSELEDDVREAKFQRITQVGDTIYAIIERVDATLSLTTEIDDFPILTEDDEEILVEEASVHELIELSFDVFTDSTSRQTFDTPTTVIDGLDHLNDKTVQVRGETTSGAGFYVFAEDVVINGRITLNTPVVTVEVGLGFTPIIQPMPVEIATQSGSTLYTPKRLTRAYVDFYESIGIFVDGVLVPYLQFGTEVLDQAPQPKTGFEEITFSNGWGARQAPTITQTVPAPMTILGVGYEVEI